MCLHCASQDLWSIRQVSLQINLFWPVVTKVIPLHPSLPLPDHPYFPAGPIISEVKPKWGKKQWIKLHQKKINLNPFRNRIRCFPNRSSSRMVDSSVKITAGWFFPPFWIDFFLKLNVWFCVFSLTCFLSLGLYVTSAWAEPVNTFAAGILCLNLSLFCSSYFSRSCFHSVLALLASLFLTHTLFLFLSFSLAFLHSTSLSPSYFLSCNL